MFTDVHAHLADERLNGETKAIVAACKARNIGSIVAAAAEVHDWQTLIDMASEFPVIRYALGVHPWYAEQWNDDACSALKAICESKPTGLVSVGEIGLDFQNGREHADLQLCVLREQLALARDYALPVVLHIRKAWPDFFALLKTMNIRSLKGVCHNFSGSPDIARQAAELGLYFSFGGPLTNPNAHRQRDVAAMIPMERLLIESDAPDCPVFSRNKGKGYPQDIVEVAETLARIRHCSLQELEACVERNADHLFKEKAAE